MKLGLMIMLGSGYGGPRLRPMQISIASAHILLVSVSVSGSVTALYTKLPALQLPGFDWHHSSETEKCSLAVNWSCRQEWSLGNVLASGRQSIGLVNSAVHEPLDWFYGNNSTTDTVHTVTVGLSLP